VGKTTTAHQLLRRFPGNVLLDSEEIGYFLQRVLGPAATVGDFQDLLLWRSLTVDMARAAPRLRTWGARRG
jgi:hypothetical protein